MKRAFACVFCALAFTLCAALSGCSYGFSVISESFSLSGGISVNYYLRFNIAKGEYNIQYTVYTENEDGNRIDEYERKDSITVGENRTACINYTFKSNDQSAVRRAAFENMQISKVFMNDGVYIYAIVAGIVSAAILAGLITLFVLDKKGKLKL